MEPATIAEMIEALLVFDEAILNSRYHGMIARYPESPIRPKLVSLPERVLESAQLMRRGADMWMRLPTFSLDADFLAWGERTLLDSFLGLAESQMRLIAYAARAAPTRPIKTEFDAAIQTHREIAGTLREALALAATQTSALRSPGEGVRGVQEEEPSGDLRSQLEKALRTAAAVGHPVRAITLSPTGLRHLRDQGLFERGETSVDGVPVVVDMGWDAPGFAIQTFDAVPLEEIVRPPEAAERPVS